MGKMACIIWYLAKYQSMAKPQPPPAPRQPQDFKVAAEVFKALGSANRLVLVDALAEGERCVADLTARLGLDISTVSNHLKVLKGVGILKDERRGTQVFYTLSKPCLLNIFSCLAEFHAAEQH